MLVDLALPSFLLLGSVGLGGVCLIALRRLLEVS